jgi:hypothetical protein
MLEPRTNRPAQPSKSACRISSKCIECEELLDRRGPLTLGLCHGTEKIEETDLTILECPFHHPPSDDLARRVLRKLLRVSALEAGQSPRVQRTQVERDDPVAAPMQEKTQLLAYRQVAAYPVVELPHVRRLAYRRAFTPLPTRCLDREYVLPDTSHVIPGRYHLEAIPCLQRSAFLGAPFGCP